MSENYPDLYDNDYNEVCKVFAVLKLQLLALNTGVDIDSSSWMDNSFGF